MTNPKYVIAPDGCCEYLTPGKKYETFNWDDDSFFHIIDDDGEDIGSIIKDSAHLNNQDWIIPTEDKEQNK